MLKERSDKGRKLPTTEKAREEEKISRQEAKHKSKPNAIRRSWWER
jgi:hypothetical protein